MSIDRRHFPRIKFTEPLRYQVRGTPEHNNAICDNISSGGIGFSNSRFVAPSTLVQLELGLLRRLLTPVGKIAWTSVTPHSDRYSMGVEFTEIDPADQKFLDDYINMHTGKL